MTSPDRPRVCALLTCFNRRQLTLDCLARLEVSARNAGLEPLAVLVDDGSSDGTGTAVHAEFPWVEVIQGAGDLFWCRGMHLAFARALESSNDFYLWLNDDTMVDAGALHQLIACHQQVRGPGSEPAIVVGSCRSPDSQEITYGGVRRSTRWWPTRFEHVLPGTTAARADTFDGNLVLIEREAALRLGNLDAVFEHAMGDYDYGLRAAKKGIACWVAPGWQAVCDTNLRAGTFTDPDEPLAGRWRQMTSRKGLPPRSWLRFNRRHSGVLWPLTFAWPYVRVVAQGLLKLSKPSVS